MKKSLGVSSGHFGVHSFCLQRPIQQPGNVHPRILIQKYNSVVVLHPAKKWIVGKASFTIAATIQGVITALKLPSM